MAKKKKTKDKARIKAKLRKQQEQQQEQKDKLTEVDSETAIENLLDNKKFLRYSHERYGLRPGMSTLDAFKGGAMERMAVTGEIHRAGMVLNLPANNIFTKRDVSVLDTIKVDFRDIPVEKLMLVKENLNIYMDDLPHLFIRCGKLELSFGKKIVTVVFSYRDKEEIQEFGPTKDEGGLVVTINNGGLVSGAHIAYKGVGVPFEMNHAYTFDQFVRDSDNYIEEDFIEFGRNDIFNLLSVLLYVNSLATTKVIRNKPSDKIYNKSNKRPESGSDKVSGVYQKEYDREIVIPRVYKLVGTELHEYDNEIKGYRKVMCRHSVSGHWRHYKSGKKVWISEFERGSGKRKSKPKVYRAKER